MDGTIQADLRRRLGEVAGAAFLAPVLQEMQRSPFKTKYFSGGHAEEVFQGQLALELAGKAGRTESSGFSNFLYRAVERRMDR